VAGHSQWANRKHRKQRQDNKRGKIFGKLSKKIISAARRSGGDPEKNTELRNIIERAQGYNMPKENIKRAIQKGTGELPGVTYEDITYEGYGPGGIAVMVDVTTDNTNRSISEIRKIFEDHEGNVGERGCVSYQFKRCGYITVDVEDVDEMELFELAVEAGAKDVEKVDSEFQVITGVDEFSDVKQAIEAAGIEMNIAEVTQIPQTTVPVDDKASKKVIKLLETLEDHDDVQQVYSNFEMDEEAMKRSEAMSA